MDFGIPNACLAGAIGDLDGDGKPDLRVPEAPCSTPTTSTA